MRQLGNWFKTPFAVGKTAVILVVVFLGTGIIYAATSNPSITSRSSIETKNLTMTAPIPFSTSTVQDNALAEGSTRVQTTGVNGVKTQTWAVTYTNGKESDRKLISETATTQPVDEVIAQGTYVKPNPPSNCPNGTYTNSEGNVVCSPYSSPTSPPGATAQCNDGTYSFSQSRRGTCSHHGGVAQWLK